MSSLSSGKISATGYIITAALSKLASMDEWRPYFSDDANRLNTGFTRHAADSLVKHGIRLLPPSGAIWLMDHLFVPGLMQHYIFRKRYIESQAEQFIAGQGRQIVNLGAGFDTLALRLAGKYPAAEFFELDLARTQAKKQSVLRQIGYPVPGNCHFVQADFAQKTLKTILSSIKEIQPLPPTFVIIEGVLMYLSESEVKALLDDLRQFFKGSLTIVFGATVKSSGSGNWSKRFINALLKRGNEGAKWSCPSSKMQAFMQASGYRIKEWVPYKQLQGFHRSEADLAKIPDEDENYYVVERTEVASTAI